MSVCKKGQCKETFVEIMTMIHDLTASSILNQLILRTPCCPGNNLFCYNTKKGKIHKIKRGIKQNTNIKSWLTANTVRNHTIFRCSNFCRCIYKNTGSLYICTYSNNAVTIVAGAVWPYRQNEESWIHIHTHIYHCLSI